jgi:acyl-CoA thioesterase
VYCFDEETRATKSADGQWRGVVSPEWNIGDNPNGGYLLSLISSALSQEITHPDPISITTHYLRPGLQDTEYQINIDVVRVGRTLSNARATLIQAGKPRLEVMAVYGDLSQSVGVENEIPMIAPIIPAEPLCGDRTGDLQGIELPIMSRLSVRLNPEQSVSGQSTEPVISGWIRFTDGREPDARSLLLFCDAFPPSPFGYLGNVGWVPTVELTVHVRQRPAAGWILGQFTTNHLADGRMIESGALWDSTGSLVAQSRQLGLILNKS